MAKDKAAGAPPDRATLHEAALRHLARFAATEAGLRRVLERRVQRWARAAAADATVVAEMLKEAAGVSRSLAAAGAVDDAVFAKARTARLLRAGRSRRAAAAHLAAKGVDAETAAAALPAAESDVPAAAILARKRRLGPFRLAPTAESRLKDLAVLARAGFAREVAERVLAMDAGEAEDLVLAARCGG